MDDIVIELLEDTSDDITITAPHQEQTPPIHETDENAGPSLTVTQEIELRSYWIICDYIKSCFINHPNCFCVYCGISSLFMGIVIGYLCYSYMRMILFV